MSLVGSTPTNCLGRYCRVQIPASTIKEKEHIMSKIEYKYIVETKESAQRRKYGDSYFHYEVESNSNIHNVKQFCKTVLHPAISLPQYNEEKDFAFDNQFRSYFTEFEEIDNDSGLNKVVYKVVQPSTH